MLVLIMGISFNSWSQSEKEIESLAKDAGWLSLLKYQRFTFFKRSLNDNPRFFIADGGKYQPEKELRANLKALKTDREYRCRFPARTKFIVREFELSRKYLEDRHCIKLRTFRRSLKTRSVALVFSSYYIKKPASMFGHTLLRLSRSTNVEERSELTDYGVNFSAEVDTGNSMLYILKGLWGGFKGKFQTLPYFYKIREYNDAESRDLWVYNLALNRRQVRFLVDHLWEMNDAHFNYFYLDENCSYHLLGLLDAVNPEWKLLKRTNLLSTVPAETIKTVMSTQGLVESVDYRPSAYARFKHHFYKLSEDEQKALEQYLNSDYDDKYIRSFGPQQKADILDAAMEYFDYKNSEAILKEELKTTAKKQTILDDRSLTPIISKEQKFEKPKDMAPHLTHATSKIAVGTANIEDNDFGIIDFQTAYHDILDYSDGFPKTMSVHMPSVRISHQDDTWLVDRLQYLKIENFQDFERLGKNISYKVDLNTRRLYNTPECPSCTPTTLGGSFGLSRVKNKSFAYLGIHQSVLYNIDLSDSIDYGIGIDATVGFFLNKQFKLKLNYRTNRYVFNAYSLPEFNFEGQYNFTLNTALNLSFEKVDESERLMALASFRF